MERTPTEISLCPSPGSGAGLVTGKDAAIPPANLTVKYSPGSTFGRFLINDPLNSYEGV